MLNFLFCKTKKELPTVPVLDITKYVGKWYEIARLPNSFEKGLECATATYSLNSDRTIKVVNQGYRIKDNSKIKIITGKAWVPDTKYPGRLKVQFFWPFTGNYYVMALDNDYSHALIGDPSRDYLWILSKTKTLDKTIVRNLLDIAKSNNFNTEKVIMVSQDCY